MGYRDSQTLFEGGIEVSTTSRKLKFTPFPQRFFDPVVPLLKDYCFLLSTPENIHLGYYGSPIIHGDTIHHQAIYSVEEKEEVVLLKEYQVFKESPKGDEGGSMFYLGIDVAKKSSRYLVLDSEGKRIISFSLENLKERFQNLLSRLQEAKIATKDILAGLEATGWFWENLYQFLQEKGFKVVLLNPYYVNKFREALAKKAKTDDIDALVIANLLRTGEYMNSVVPEEKIQVLREYTNLRYEFLRTRQDYQRKVISLLGVVFPEYERTALKNPFGVAPLQILKEFPTAKDLALAKPRHIEKIVRSIQGNNFDLKEIQSLIDWAKNSIYSGRAKEARGVSLKMLLGQVQALNSNIQEIDKSIEDILSPGTDDSFPGENLLSIPGVGKKTIAAVLSYLGVDGSSFCSAKKVTGYVGFFPRLYQSGETKRENRISHRGPKVLRWALYMSAVSCLIHNKEMRVIYQRKISQGKSAKQALIVVAKKLLEVMLAMLKSGKTYNPIQVYANT